LTLFKPLYPPTCLPTYLPTSTILGESSDLAAGITALCSGGVIAVPTDTIYGLAASAQNEAAVQKIYDIKRRIESKPLAICVGNIDQVYK